MVVIHQSLIFLNFCHVLSFQDYISDLKTKSAVERQLVIVGEAVGKFRKAEPGLELKNSKEIINFRNRLVHAYDSIDDSIVWAIKVNHLGKLKTEVQDLISE